MKKNYPMTKKIYSKKNSDLLNLRNDLFIKDKYFMKKMLQLNKIYSSGPRRKNCIICNNSISLTDFVSHGVAYSFCRKCNHLNGKNQISKKFNKFAYVKSGSKKLTNQYSNNFNRRVEKIYLPKVIFLKKVVKEKISVLDVGCGAGQLIKSCEKMKIKAIGVDPNKNLIEFGKKFIKKNRLINLDFENCLKEISNTSCKVVSLIFVLEHLENPNQVFLNFRKSKAKYLYISVPLFSLGVMFELGFQKNYSRNLGGSHTNLYTKESLRYLCKKYKLQIVGEWWFGSDYIDLYTKLINSSEKNSKFYKSKVNNFFKENIDLFQNTLDKTEFCSDIHIILKKK